MRKSAQHIESYRLESQSIDMIFILDINAISKIFRQEFAGWSVQSWQIIALILVKFRDVLHLSHECKHLKEDKLVEFEIVVEFFWYRFKSRF